MALAAFTWASTFASGAAADAPDVVTDIAPVNGLVARVMDGVGTPTQIISPGASPHGYAMRPSEAAALAEADAVFWIGPELTPWLSDTIETVAPDAQVTALLPLAAIVLAYREGPVFGAGHGADDHSEGEHEDAHDHGEHDHDNHGHEDHGHDEHGHDDHAHDEHGNDNHAHDDHAHDHGHGHDHSGDDPHAWLSPENAKAWLGTIADTLSEIDPANAEAYAANAADGRAEIDAAEADVAAMLSPLEGARFVVFHDAYHYFEHHFDMHAAGSIAAGDASDPGPARIEAVRGMIADLNVSCVLSEPALNPAFVDTVIEGSGARAGVIDPLGADLVADADFYPSLLRDMGTQLAECAG